MHTYGVSAVNGQYVSTIHEYGVDPRAPIHLPIAARCSRGREHRYAVGLQCFVHRDEREVLELRLGDEHAIKRIAVMPWKRGRYHRVPGGDVEETRNAWARLLSNEVRDRDR
jgi:hypothetical protein